MYNIKLTIAVPVYNGGEPLIEAIESCKNITLPITEFEILIVDNCSTDNVINEVISRYRGTLPIRVIYNDFNCGRINNWNKCLDFALGEIILFLFANDLITKNNSIESALAIFHENNNCSLVSAPWIISDFKQTLQHQEPEFLKRTPGSGIFKAKEHIIQVVESGKLPFVCLQSCFLRNTLIQKNSIKFDERIPLTTDGVFLSALALTTNYVAFISKTTMIFRHDAPNRQHANVKLDQHLEQMLTAFREINQLLLYPKINLSLAFIQFSGLENMLVFLLKNPNKKGIYNAIKMISSWRRQVLDSNLNFTFFTLLLVKRFCLLPFKGFPFLFKYFK